MSTRDVAWFTSDIHLYYGGRDYLDVFLNFLRQAEKRTKTLYIVGDLFEFWIGDRQAGFEFYKPLFEQLKALTAKGGEVKIIQGNRDFLLGQAFARAGAELLPDEIVLNLGGNRVHVSHGDQFCIHDLSYQRARKIMRSRPIRTLAALLPASLGLFLARAYRGISERKKRRKNIRGGGNRFHTIKDGVERSFQSGTHDTILCGHIHYPKDQILTLDLGQRRVLTTGAWEEGPNYVAFDGSDLVLRRFDPLRGDPPFEKTSVDTCTQDGAAGAPS